jgi:hypothetical protein
MTNEKTAYSTVSMVESITASITQRSMEARHQSNIILFTRNPLDIVFDWLGEVLHNAISGMRRDKFVELSKTVEGHDLSFVRWKIWLHAMCRTGNSYNTMMVTGEDREDRLLQPSLLAEVSRFIGIAANQTAIRNGI